MSEDLIEVLRATLGAEKVIDDDSARALLSKDLAPPDDGVVAAVVVQVKTPEDIAAVLTVARNHNTSVAVRGGGMSYTGGYQPADADSFLLDLSHMDKIVTLSEFDRFMVVESGCTWQSVEEALDGTGLKPVQRGPISGAISTVGGAASQNIPGSMEGILGLEVMTAEGELIRTGSLGAHGGNAFYRNYGPDLTGMFLGDNGTLGIKTKVALRLESIPAGIGLASFAFDTMRDVTDAMVRIAQKGLTTRLIGLDPLKNKTATKVSTREGVETLKDIATKSSKGIVGGVVDAAKVAIAGKKAFDDVPWSMHVFTEGVDQTAADSALLQVSAIALERGRSIEASIPIAMAAKPYTIRGFLGIRGERWIPLMAIFPFSQVEKAITETENFFDRHADVLNQHGVIHSFMLSAEDGFLLIEPMFYWFDELLPLHVAALGEDTIKKFGALEAHPNTQALVTRLRSDLRDLFFDLGAVSLQIGAFYRFQESISEPNRTLLKRIRSLTNPSDIINPQNQKI